MSKKHKWEVYKNSNGEIIEIIVRDFSGAKIETFKFNIEDRKRGELVMKSLNEKYGFNPFKRKDKDIEWLRRGDLF